MPPRLRGEQLRELEARWRLRLRKVRECYRHAIEQHQRMTRELDQKLVPVSDGAFAVLTARRARAMALNELVRVEKIWTQFVLKGQSPPPDDDERLIF